MASRLMLRRAPARVPWRWDGAIAMFGLARLATRSTAARGRSAAYIAEYLEHHAGRARVRMPDHCAPAIAAVAARPLLGDARVRDATAGVVSFLRSQPRNGLGALDHLGVDTPLAAIYPASIWIDSLMMYALPAVMLGRQLGDRTLEQFGHRQPSIFARALQDPRGGLFRHAFLHERRVPRPRDPVFWLRGNGWVAAALVDMLELDLRPRNAAIFRRLCSALMLHQRPDGGWSTVIGDARTYVESSGSALVGYALAKGWRLGLLGADARVAAERAMDALTSRLRPTSRGPSLTSVSGPTIPSGRLGYAAVARRRDLDFGVGALLLLAVELDTHREPLRRECNHSSLRETTGPDGDRTICTTGTRQCGRPLNRGRSSGRRRAS